AGEEERAALAIEGERRAHDVLAVAAAGARRQALAEAQVHRVGGGEIGGIAVEILLEHRPRRAAVDLVDGAAVGARHRAHAADGLAAVADGGLDDDVAADDDAAD